MTQGILYLVNFMSVFRVGKTDSEFGNVDVLKWIKHGVDIHEVFHHFKGNFKGKHFDSDIPP